MPEIISDGQIPVFVCPPVLTFCLQDESTRKQVITIYNPYEFAVNYIVLSNAPENYNISDCSGILHQHNRIDILIRHRNLSTKYLGCKDKIRVQITESGKSKVIGIKDIGINITKNKAISQSSEEKEIFERVPRGRSENLPTSEEENFTSIHEPISRQNIFKLQIMMIILCLIVLSMPTECTSSPTSVPPFLHFSTVFKCVATFILGLIVGSIKM